MNVLGHYNYWIVIFLMMVGFYTIIARGNLVKKVVGLTVFQTSVFIFYISIANILGGTAPILVGGVSHGEGEEAHGEAEEAHVEGGGEAAGEASDGAAEAVQGAVEEGARAAGSALEWGGSTTFEGVTYSNPLPHVLILTAIVVGIATTALALALVVRIKETYGTIEEDEIHEMDLEMENAR